MNYLFAPVDTQLVEGKGLDAYPGDSWRTFAQEFRKFPSTVHALGEVATQLSINSFEQDIIDQSELDGVIKGFKNVITPPLDDDENYHFDLGSDRAKIANGIFVAKLDT